MRRRTPRVDCGTLLEKLTGFTTNMSQLSSSNIRSAVLPISNRLYPEREMAPITTIAAPTLAHSLFDRVDRLTCDEKLTAARDARGF